MFKMGWSAGPPTNHQLVAIKDVSINVRKCDIVMVCGVIPQTIAWVSNTASSFISALYTCIHIDLNSKLLCLVITYGKKIPLQYRFVNIQLLF